MYTKLQGDYGAIQLLRRIEMIVNKGNMLLTNKVRQRWKELFEEMLNRSNPEKVARSIETIDEITLDPITRAETWVAIPGMSAAKALCEDDINVELLNADITTSVDTLHHCF